MDSRATTALPSDKASETSGDILISPPKPSSLPPCENNNLINQALINLIRFTVKRRSTEPEKSEPSLHGPNSQKLKKKIRRNPKITVCESSVRNYLFGGIDMVVEV